MKANRLRAFAGKHRSPLGNIPVARRRSPFGLARYSVVYSVIGLSRPSRWPGQHRRSLRADPPGRRSGFEFPTTVETRQGALITSP